MNNRFVINKSKLLNNYLEPIKVFY